LRRKPSPTIENCSRLAAANDRLRVAERRAQPAWPKGIPT
jgi:hypothetical protein